MKNDYKRRADFDEMPWPSQLGILKTELAECAETDEEKADALASAKRMEEIIEQHSPKPPKGAK